MRLGFIKKLVAACIVVPVIAVLSLPVYAEDGKQVKELNIELDDISSEEGSTSKKLEEVEMLIEMIDSEIIRVNERLEDVKDQGDKMYADMKSRIKYMYESGTASLAEMLMTCDNIASFVNAADFIKEVGDYDRKRLEELVSVMEDIEAEEQALNDLKTAADELKSDLSSRTVASKIADGAKTRGEALAASASDQVLLAAIIECETGQDYDALLAVATVILNRVASPKFGNTIHEVVYATNQFAPVVLGSLDAVLSRGPSELSMQVAEDALSGVKLAAVSDCYFFLSASYSDRAGVVVGGNVFFQGW